MVKLEEKNSHPFGLRGFPQTTLTARISNFVAVALPANCRATADQRSKRRRTSDLSSTSLCCASVTWRKCHRVVTGNFAECGVTSKKSGKKVKILGQKPVVPFKEGPFLFDLQVMFNCRCVAHDFCWGQWLLVNKKTLQLSPGDSECFGRKCPKIALMLSGGLKF